MSPRKKQRRRTIVIGGIRFLSTGDGHYRSACGRWALFHMMRSTIHAQWELYSVEGDNDCARMLDSAVWLTEILWRSMHEANYRRDVMGDADVPR